MSREEASSNSQSENAATKLCHIVKRANFDGYGFNLHSEKIKPGQYIGKVDANSPAEAAGLKEGDRILQVNGVPIGDETHKQVVQRIKAISNEVRLVLVDVDSAAATATTHSKSTDNSEHNEYKGIVKEIPGASANISSISMISTKRTSNSNQQSNSMNSVTQDDEVDTALASNGMPTIPLPPSAISASMSTGTNKIANGNGNAAANINANNGKTTGSGLRLPPTAKEMRAKLLSKKKYDPKAETVDLKKKFDIIKDL